MNVQIDRRTMYEPGTPVTPMSECAGLWTLYLQEVRRFFEVRLQTIWRTALTTPLFRVIFTVALGRAGRTVMGVPFADFIAPGLIIMGMMQNAFANSSFGLLVGKVQGTIVDYLMQPLSTGDLLTALTAAAGSGRASCKVRVCQYVKISVGGVS